jgi:hypothetical protein
LEGEVDDGAQANAGHACWPEGHVKVDTKVMVKSGVLQQVCNNRHTKHSYVLKQS